MLFLHLQHIKNIGIEIMDTPFSEKKLLIWELRRLSCKMKGNYFPILALHEIPGAHQFRASFVVFSGVISGNACIIWFDVI